MKLLQTLAKTAVSLSVNREWVIVVSKERKSNSSF